tara:strand:- start:2978 stop:3421 length:444 start_codon:yes stop_codon:yes gene_type:complete
LRGNNLFYFTLAFSSSILIFIDTCRNPRDWVTDKVLVAAKVLYERKKYGPALLFVNRRLFAFVLYHILYIEQQQGFIRGGEDTSYLRLGVAVGNAMCFNSDHQLFPGHLVYNKDQRDEFIFPGKQWMDVVNFTHGLSGLIFSISKGC